MSHDPVDRDGATRARDLFERASAGVDPTTAARLARARRDALRPRSVVGPARWAPVAAAACVVALVVAWWQPGPGPAPAATTGVDPVGPAATPAIDDIAIDADDIARLLDDEDPDLYAWLADAPVATSTGAAP